MSTKDKLETIDYICNRCSSSDRIGCRRHSGNHEFIKQPEERFDSCSILRQRLFKIDMYLNNTIHGEDLINTIKQ